MLLPQSHIFDVIGIGSCSFDTTFSLPVNPPWGSKIEIGEVTQQGGGLIGTAIATLARLGNQVAFVGRVGTDATSEKLVEELRFYGVSTQFLKPSAGSTCRKAFVLVNALTSERTVFWSKNNAPTLAPEEFDTTFVSQARWLLVDCHEPRLSAAAIAEAKLSGVKIAIDADSETDEVDSFIENASLIFASSSFAQSRFPRHDHAEASQALSSASGGIAVVTDGIRGSWITAEGTTFHQPAYLQIPTVDTTGAGDVYHGAFLHSLIQGKTLLEASRFASAAAALKCRHFGGRTGIPSLTDIQSLIGQYEFASA